MSNFLDDQTEELEVLQSIFPQELRLVSSSAPWKFSIVLQASDTDAENHVTAELIVSFPSSYPETTPELAVESRKGLSEAQIGEIASLANRIAAENVGMPCVFAVAEAVKEWLQDNNVAGQDGSMYADMMRRMQQKEVEIKKKQEKAAVIAAADAEQYLTKESVDKEEEERIRKRQAGTAVTIESFMAWKAAFDEEQRQILLATQGKEIVKDERPTGKQLFQSNRAGLEEALLAALEAGDQEGEGEEGLDFGDLRDYEGLVEGNVDDDDEDDEDYDPDEEGDDDEDYNEEDDS